MHKPFHADIIILGGGITGLWLLNGLHRAGYRTMLLERNELGGGQTLASQGIIHGGIKFSLGGTWTSATETIAGMPDLWRACLQGDTEPDLGAVELLSAQYYLFSDRSIGSKLVSFLGSRAVRGQVRRLARQDYPPAFSDPAFAGWLYRIGDLVIDPMSLVDTLLSSVRESVFRVHARIVCDTSGKLDHLVTEGGLELRARHYIFAAGSGNGELVEQTRVAAPATQLRPLHQVMVCDDALPPLFAHAVSLGTADKPRLTITTHRTNSGHPVWYLGGELAETGVTRDESGQIEAARQELASLFPWMDFSRASCATHLVDRA